MAGRFHTYAGHAGNTVCIRLYARGKIFGDFNWNKKIFPSRHFVSLVNQLIQLFYILCLAGRRMLCLGRVLLYGSLGLLDRLHGSRTGYAAAWAGIPSNR